MMRSELIEAWRHEEQQPRRGWDLARFHEQCRLGPLPWDYERLAREAIRCELPEGSGCLLDIGTGGGEVLARLSDAFPERVFATEGWPPNVPVARERLAPLGVSVLPSVAGQLPFDAEAFALILNRMAGYRAAEVARVAKPGAAYLTQQLDSHSHDPIRRAFGREPGAGGGSLDERVRGLEAEGFVIELARQHAVELTYADVRAVVCHLATMPWVVSDFSVERDLEHLLQLQAGVDAGRTLSFTHTYLLIGARKGRPR
jgi:hypothetical protein